MIKKLYAVILIVLVGISIGISVYYFNERDDTLLLATTTSVDNTGLLDLLIEAFTEETGIEVSVLAKGSGAAVDLGKKGEVDAVLVHAPDLEKDFMDEGYGEEHKTLWYNYFVVAGSSDDVANISKATNVTEAFDRIYSTGEAENTEFYSRGDNSGTHIKELGIWTSVPSAADNQWYIETGAGMSATLTTANEHKGYTLSDIGTFASLKGTDVIPGLEILYDKGDELYNPYSYMVVSSEMYPDLRTDNAYEFLEFLQGDIAKDIVRNLVIGGTQLFKIIGE